ncbi:DUF7024 domain-containing protein [Pseudoduganella namucuonensis]|uniref:Phosphoglycerol transferase n=1 Tax=Pseudoduganella namucuonensis TaxID=1035707 RepID=A0A1I7FT18_9BURK|nr:hypothetical protein [Pseudoduganella namucuonensis]SFU39313.1 phosphoglycerol transferase [Pseudoduganella namucuonensis]
MNLNDTALLSAGIGAGAGPRRAGRAAGAALLLAMLAVFLHLTLRDRGLYPMVFADEWLYDRYARLEPLSASVLPSYLYLKLFGATSACGAGFLDCARMLNAALFVLAAPFIYLVARPVTGRAAALAIAAASMLAPVNSYTAYFMPESMYYLGFWVVSWCLLSARGGVGLAGGLLAGALLGAMAVVKVHALFLLPALALFMLWRGWTQDAARAALAGALALAASALGVKLALGWLLAGPNGLSILGSFYGNHANGGGEGALARLLPPALVNLHGHAMALMLLFAVPLLAFAASAGSAAVRRELDRPGRALLAYTVLALGAALGMTVAFTASIAHIGPLEGLRLHLRYYDFAFPLLAMAAASPALAQPQTLARRLALALPCAALLAYASLRILPAYSLSYVDGPEVFNATYDRNTRAMVAGLQLLVIALWVWRPAIARAAFLWLLLPMFAYNSVTVSRELMARGAQPNAYDLAGQYAYRALPPERRGELAIAGAEPSGLARAQFNADSAAIAAIELAPGSAFEAYQLPARRKMLLLVGPHALPPEIKAERVAQDVALVRMDVPYRPLHRLDFSRPLAAPVEGVQGMEEAESWGRWSNAKQVALRLAQPLPHRLALFLDARAYGPNVGQEFVLTVGGQQRRFKLRDNPQELYFEFDTDGAQRDIAITVPAPTVPAELGQGNDSRALGMGLISMEIGQR